MAITQRDEFSSVIAKSGGKVDGLITRLREKTVSLDKNH
jgi:ABC-type transporter MlaC component